MVSSPKWPQQKPLYVVEANVRSRTAERSRRNIRRCPRPMRVSMMRRLCMKAAISGDVSKSETKPSTSVYASLKLVKR